MKYKSLILGLGMLMVFLLPVNAMTCTWNGNETALDCEGDVSVANNTEVVCTNLNDANFTGSSGWVYDEMLFYRDSWKECVNGETNTVEANYIPTESEVKNSDTYNSLEEEYSSLQEDFDDYKDSAVAYSTYSTCDKELDSCKEEVGTSWHNFVFGALAVFGLLYLLNKSPKELIGRKEPKQDVEDEFGWS